MGLKYVPLQRVLSKAHIIYMPAASHQLIGDIQLPTGVSNNGHTYIDQIAMCILGQWPYQAKITHFANTQLATSTRNRL